jgi:hypothetical protein
MTSWIIYTLVSATLVKDIDHKKFKSHSDCQKHIVTLQYPQRKSCFTNKATFKHKRANK